MVNFTFFVQYDDSFSIDNCFRNNVQLLFSGWLVEYILRFNLKQIYKPVVSLVLRVEQLVGSILFDCYDGAFCVEIIIRQIVILPYIYGFFSRIELSETLFIVDFDVVDLQFFVEFLH